MLDDALSIVWGREWWKASVLGLQTRKLSLVWYQVGFEGDIQLPNDDLRAFILDVVRECDLRRSLLPKAPTPFRESR